MTNDPSASKPSKPVPFARRIGMFPIRVYQVTLAWLMGGNCRFTPSCSHYALEAIEKHGFFKGWWLALCRLARCQPCCKGGHDPVPPAPQKDIENKGNEERI